MTIKEGKVRYFTPINTGRSTINSPMISKMGECSLMVRLEGEETPAAQPRPGFSFGCASRMDVKKWDFNEVKRWPKCSFTKPKQQVTRP